MQKFTAIKEKVTALEADAEAFYNKGNKAAGVRLRKGMLDLKNLAQDVRVSVTDARNNA